MGPIGVPEMLFILAIALLIFGPKRLPEFGRTIGKALGEFRRATTDLKRSIDVEMTAAEPTPAKPAAAPAPAAAPVAREKAPERTGPEAEEGPAGDAAAAEPAAPEPKGDPSA